MKKCVSGKENKHKCYVLTEILSIMSQSDVVTTPHHKYAHIECA